MAHKIVITKKFESKAARISQWIEKEWSLKLSIAFDKKISKYNNRTKLQPNHWQIIIKK